MTDRAPRPVMVGVAGGSGSGKTTVVRRLVEGFRPDPTSVIHHDAYYRDLSDLEPGERDRINFDHPRALETELLVHHLEELRAGRAVEVPSYDFVTHTRKLETGRVDPTRTVIVDGLLVLAEPLIRALLDVRVYVDTAADLRFIRRLERDVRERGRDVDSVIQQYLKYVRPMHLEFVEPSRKHADIVIAEGGRNETGVQWLLNRISAELERA